MLYPIIIVPQIKEQFQEKDKGELILCHLNVTGNRTFLVPNDPQN